MAKGEKRNNFTFCFSLFAFQNLNQSRHPNTGFLANDIKISDMILICTIYK
jgi:hypothetical protein